MRTIHFLETTIQQFLSEQRRSQRQIVHHLLVVTNRGTGQVIDFSCDGLSFGCLYPHNFTETFSLDILDAKGNHIKNLQAKSVWQRTAGEVLLTERFEMETGVTFLNLTKSQREELEALSEAIVGFDYKSPIMI